MDAEGIGFICIIASGTIFGIVISSFILLTIWEDSLKKQKVSSADKIVISLSFSNLCLCSFRFTTYILYVKKLENTLSIIIEALFSYGMISTIWLTSCLCFFHFIKIVQFSSRLLSWLKMKIDVLVPWLIMAVELVTLGLSFLSEVVKHQDYFIRMDMPKNKSGNYSTTENQFYGLYTALKLSTPLSLGCMVLITAWTSASLTLHIRRMERTIGSSSTANDKAKRVVHTMVYLLIYYIVYFLVLVLPKFANIQSDFTCFYLYRVVLFSFSHFQFILLILNNLRYKERFSSMCLCCRFFLK